MWKYQFQCLVCNAIFTQRELKNSCSWAPCGHSYAHLEPFKEPSAHMTRHNSIGVIFKKDDTGLIHVCVVPDNGPVYYLVFETDAQLVEWYKLAINRRAA